MTHVQYVDTRGNAPTHNKVVTRAVTVLDAPSLFVCGVRFYGKSHSGSLVILGEKWSDSIPKDLEISRTTMPGKKASAIDNSKISDVRLIAATQPKKSGMDKKKPDVFELGIGGKGAEEKAKLAESYLGKELSAKDVFKAGEWIDVAAVTKGSGFTGPVKRYGIRIQGRKDRQMNRHPGSIGPTTPRKVSWRVPMAGQYGFFTRTEFTKRLLGIGDDSSKINPAGAFLRYGMVPGSYIIVEGSVPGPSKRLVFIKKAVRSRRKDVVTELKHISTDSKQGLR
jgi:large subunit ribosomal protein L3